MDGDETGQNTVSHSDGDRALVQELLQVAQKEHGGGTGDKGIAPRRNTKGDIIAQIWQLKDTANLPMEHSETALRRKSKNELSEILATMMEDASRKALAKTVGAVDDQPSSIQIAALRMMFDTAVSGLEKGSASILPAMGYSAEGLLKNSQTDPTSAVINQCLREITILNPTILSKVASPYVRLSMAMISVCVTTIHEVPVENLGYKEI